MSDDAPSTDPQEEGVATPSRPAKSSPAHKAMMARRMNDMVAWRLKGASFRKVRQSVAELERREDSAWFAGSEGKSLSARSLRRYISKADKEIAVRSQKSRERLTYRQLARREDLYHECRTKGDSATALQVLKDMDTLRGLYPPTKSALTNPEGDKEYAGGLAHLAGLGPLLAEFRLAMERRRAEIGGGAGEWLGASLPPPVEAVPGPANPGVCE